jgi:hypothetical protein
MNYPVSRNTDFQRVNKIPQLSLNAAAEPQQTPSAPNLSIEKDQEHKSKT